MSAPPRRRSALGGGSESAPGSLGDDHSIAATSDLMPLRHGLSAVCVRDTDPLSVAFRKMRRRVPLIGTYLEAYEAWLADQRQDATS